MKYIVLLRGINISGKNKIAMPRLKTILEENGFENVITYLNSGNVILDSGLVSKDELAVSIGKIIYSEFGLDIPIFVTSVNELEDVLESHPDWWATSDKNIYDNLIFVISPTKSDEIFSTIGSPSKDIDKVQEYKNHIFWSFDLKNYRKSNWWIKTASTSIKDKITIRTANTIKKVLELAKK